MARVPPEWRTGHETIWTDFTMVLAVLVLLLAGAGAAVVLRLDTRAKEQQRDALALQRHFRRGKRGFPIRAATVDGKRRAGAEAYTLEDTSGLAEMPRVRTSPWDSRRLTFCRRMVEALGLREGGSRAGLGGRGSAAENVTLDVTSSNTTEAEADADPEWSGPLHRTRGSRLKTENSRCKPKRAATPLETAQYTTRSRRRSRA
ncbi:MAG: hypothetical protein ACLR8U_01310 [Oscillospiraceae bacterium]